LISKLPAGRAEISIIAMGSIGAVGIPVFSFTVLSVHALCATTQGGIYETSPSQIPAFGGRRRRASDRIARRAGANIAAIAPKDVPPNISAHSEKLYLSPLAWSYFHAYQTTVLLHFTMIKGLEFGLANIIKFVKLDPVREILKAALPRDATFIETCEPTDFALLLGDLENALMGELKNILDGKIEDEADIDRANRINQTLKRLRESES
jgi:hypothetical protein